jgi:uncharacterized protein YoxC
VSAGEIAGLIAAVAFVLLVGLLAVPILKLGRTLDEATLAIRKTHEGVQPLLTGAGTTVEHVNKELERVDGITQGAQAVTSNVAALTSVFASTLGGPVVRLAAFSYGVRRAAQRRQRSEAEQAARQAARAERRQRRAARRARAGG